MTGHQTIFLRYSLRFALFALAFAFVLRGYSLAFLPAFLANNLSIGQMMTSGPTGLLIVPVCIAYFIYNRAKALEIMGALLGTALLTSSFILIKTAIPVMVPFWADPMLAAWDRSLFGGVDGYAWAHDVAPFVSAKWAEFIYVPLWGIAMMLFPAFVVLFERDMARKQRYLMIYFFSWIGLGLVMATIFSSAGPIYFERITGETGFGELQGSLAALGFEQSLVRNLQEALWMAYEADGGQQLVGSGISAFPSMHVAMGALWACYLVERAGWVGMIGVAYALVLLFLSVFLGWHYALDGIVSIAVIALAAAAPALMRRYRGASHLSGEPEMPQTAV